MVKSKNEHIGVCVIVLDENKKSFLLGKRKNSIYSGKLGLPGGKLELNETFEVCSERELLEETSLKSKRMAYVGVVRELQNNYNFIHFVYSCSEYNGSPANTEPEKCEGWKWYPLNQLPKNILPGHKAALELFLNPSSSLKQLLTE